MNRAEAILKNTFGYNSFRSLQAEIISCILAKQDVMVVMPTGGGKSLCYQVPALIFEGLTIVISPLISLMKDQVLQLKQLGIHAVVLNSSLTRDEYYDNFDDVKIGRAKLLYIAPESLLREDISHMLQGVKVDCIAVDEAHCISEWGHDFRKEYRLLASFRGKFPSAVCAAFTATATVRVREDIIKSLKLSHCKKFVASFNRENLFLKVTPKDNPFQQTLDFLEEHKDQSGIIYCFSRKQVDDLHEKLSSLGYLTRPYHAGLTDAQRSKNQELFINDKIDIIIATIAFGMGINKPDVRFVLHYDLPKNLESYYQEIGRSGRDGLRSDCLLLFSYADSMKINYFIEQKESEKERLSAKAHLNAMLNYAESAICRRNPLINYFNEKYDHGSCRMCDNCTTEEKELVDLTTHAQKFLSTVKRTGEVFGAVYIIDVLTGKDSERLIANAHHKLTLFGLGADLNKSQWQYILQQFISKELIYRDMEFGSLKLTPKGKTFLLSGEKISGRLKEKTPSKEKKKAAITQRNSGQNIDLFDILRKKRKELAEELNVPPYIIFSDKALIEMSTYLPKDNSSFLEINGVGKKKLETFGKIFLTIIKDYCYKN